MARTVSTSTHGVKSSTSLAATTLMSWCGWVKAPTATGTACKMLACHGDRWRISLNAEKYGGGTPTAAALFFGRSWGTTDELSQTAAISGWANWNHVAVTYDGGSVSNAAKFYLNGVLQTTTFTRGAAGSIDNATDAPVFGNDVGMTLAIGGTIAAGGWHNVILTPAEIIEAMVYGYTARGLYRLYMLEGNDSPEPDRSGLRANGTVTGTTGGVANPPIRPGFFGFRGFTRRRAASAQVVAIGQVSSTETAQPLGRTKRRAVAQTSTTELAQPLTRAKRRAIAQTATSELAQPVTRAKRRAIGQTSTTETAQPVIRRGLINQVATVELAQPLGRRKSRTLGQVASSELAQPLGRRKARAVGLVTTTEFAQAVRVNKRLLQVASTDLAQPLTRAKRRTVGQVTTVELAQPLGRRKLRTLGQVTSVEFAQAVGAPKRVLIGQVAATETAQPVGSVLTPVGIPTIAIGVYR